MAKNISITSPKLLKSSSQNKHYPISLSHPLKFLIMLVSFRLFFKIILAIISVLLCSISTFAIGLGFILLKRITKKSRLSRTLNHLHHRSGSFLIYIFSNIFSRILNLRVQLFEFLPQTAEFRLSSSRKLRRALQKTQTELQLSEAPILQANHISFLDVIVIGQSIPTSFLAKKEVKNWPIIGTMTKWAYVIFVDRESMIDRYKSIFRIKEKLSSTPICVFPEATTTNFKTPRYSLWQSGNQFVACKNPRIILALSVHYQDIESNAWVREESFAHLLIRILKRTHTDIYLGWSLIEAKELTGSTCRARSLEVFWHIYKQCALFYKKDL